MIVVDDFGLHEGVNRAALALLMQGRVSAVGALVDAPAWPEGAAALRSWAALPAAATAAATSDATASARAPCDVGLHLNLTDRLAGGEPFCPSLVRLIAMGAAGALDLARLRREIHRQLDRFERGWGRMPDFVDGHRHVHQLSGVAASLVALLAERYPQPRPWLRCTTPRWPSGLWPGSRAVGIGAQLKAGLIAALGSRALARLAEREGFAQNRRLHGVYRFEGSAAAHQRRLAVWLAAARDGDALMCHPAATLLPGDPIAPARVIEYQALSSEEFGAALVQHGVRVSRLPNPCTWRRA